MKIEVETKFNSDDYVWTIIDNEVVQGCIGEIVIKAFCNDISLVYNVAYNGHRTFREENKMFSSKEELIASL